jgi:hypothetical protein
VGPRSCLDRCRKSRPTGIRSPDSPVRSQSLYRLRYPAHTYDNGALKTCIQAHRQRISTAYYLIIPWKIRKCWEEDTKSCALGTPYAARYHHIISNFKTIVFQLVTLSKFYTHFLFLYPNCIRIQCGSGQRSRYSDSLRAERSGKRILMGGVVRTRPDRRPRPRQPPVQ